MERQDEEPTFKINGDSKDSSTAWSDYKNKLINECGIEDFIGPVGSPIVWNLNQTLSETVWMLM